VYDYAVQKVSEAPSKDYWSLSRILMMLTRLLALVSMIVFLLINYKDSFLVSTLFDQQELTNAPPGQRSEPCAWVYDFGDNE
jgi:hypothetical protein